MRLLYEKHKEKTYESRNTKIEKRTHTMTNGFPVPQIGVQAEQKGPFTFS